MPRAGKPPGGLRLFVVLGGLSAFAPLSLDMYLPAFPTIERDFHTSASAVQLTLTACLAGLALGQLVAGPLSDALGRRRPLFVGIVGYSVASFLCAAAPSVYVLMPLRLCQGTLGAAGIVIARAVVRDLHSGAKAARYFSRLMLISGLAPIFAPSIGSLILRLTSWRGVFVLLGLIGIVLLALALVVLPETLPPERRHTGGLATTLRTFRVLVGDRGFVGHALVLGCSIGAIFAYISGSAFVLEDIHGLSPQLFALVFGINGIAIVVCAQVNASLVTRIPAERLLAGGVAVAAAASFLLLAGTLVGGLGLAATLVPFFLVLGSAGFIMPNTTALAMADQAERAGSASALLGVVQFTIGAIVAPLVGLAGSGSALPLSLVMASLGGLSILALVVVARPAQRAAHTAALLRAR